MPLMFGQLVTAIYQVIILNNLYIMSSLIIIFVWIFIFFQFASIHSNISKGIVNKSMLKKLVNKN